MGIDGILVVHNLNYHHDIKCRKILVCDKIFTIMVNTTQYRILVKVLEVKERTGQIFLPIVEENAAITLQKVAAELEISIRGPVGSGLEGHEHVELPELPYDKDHKNEYIDEEENDIDLPVPEVQIGNAIGDMVEHIYGLELPPTPAADNLPLVKVSGGICTKEAAP